MSFIATARRIGDGLQHEVDVNGRHMLVTDEPVELGGSDLGPAPHELLPAMVASCVSTTVALYARRHGWPLGALSVDVDYDPQATPRPLAIALHLPADLPLERIERLRRVAESCPVRRALEAGFTFDETTAVDAAPAGAAV